MICTMDDTLLAAIRIAEGGFCGGDPLRVLEMPVDWAMDLLHFMRFRNEFEVTAAILNTPKS